MEPSPSGSRSPAGRDNPTDYIMVEPLPFPEHPAERFIRGVWTGDRWELEVQLNRLPPRRNDHLGAAREFVEAADLLLAEDASERSISPCSTLLSIWLERNFSVKRSPPR